MKELELEFNGSGEVSNFVFKQLKASTCAYVYEIGDENNKQHYECFERKEQQESETVLQGIKILRIAKVIYPKSNEFGKSAWCFKDFSKAQNRFEEINERMMINAFQSVILNETNSINELLEK
jgi:hypothetical protein